MEYQAGLAVQRLMDADAERQDYRLFLMNGAQHGVCRRRCRCCYRGVQPSLVARARAQAACPAPRPTPRGPTPKNAHRRPELCAWLRRPLGHLAAPGRAPHAPHAHGAWGGPGGPASVPALTGRACARHASGLAPTCGPLPPALQMTTPGNHEIDWFDYGFYKAGAEGGFCFACIDVVPGLRPRIRSVLAQ